MQLINKRITFTKGQLISKCLFGVFNSSKKRTKKFCYSKLGQKFPFYLIPENLLKYCSHTDHFRKTKETL